MGWFVFGVMMVVGVASIVWWLRLTRRAMALSKH
jgi:hypothetical protein